jgi:hypothetical protein
MTSIKPRVNYQAWLRREDLNDLAKRLYHTVALKRAQAMRFAWRRPTNFGLSMLAAPLSAAAATN